MPDLTAQLAFGTTYFDLFGARLHAVVAGPAGAPLVILLHGFPEFWYEWREIIGPLATAGFRVIAPDQRGYNFSSRAAPFDLQTVSGDVVNLIRAAGYDVAHVVGHDWGGAAAWAVAAWHPEVVRRLVVINLPNPLAMNDSLLRFNLRQYLRSTYVVYFQLPWLPEWSLRRLNFSLIKRGLLHTALPGAYSAADLARYAEAWSQQGALSAMLGWYRAVWTSRRQVLASRSQFSHILAPTLLLWGERDPALGPELALASMPLMADGRLIRYPNNGHWLPAEAPAEVTKQLLAHLA